MAHTVNAAIQVEVDDDRLDYVTACEFVETALRGAFTSPTDSYRLTRVDTHPDADLLFPRPGRDVDGEDENVCECGDTGWFAEPYELPDLPPAANVQRCDLCEKYPGDIEAAQALAAARGGQVNVIAGELVDGEQMIFSGTDPWVSSTAVCATCGAVIAVVDGGWKHLPPWGEHEEPIVVEHGDIKWWTAEDAERAGYITIIEGDQA